MAWAEDSDVGKTLHSKIYPDIGPNTSFENDPDLNPEQDRDSNLDAGKTIYSRTSPSIEPHISLEGETEQEQEQEDTAQDSGPSDGIYHILL